MESLNDPTDDRVIKEVPAPPHRPISDDLLYPNKCKWRPVFHQPAPNAMSILVFLNINGRYNLLYRVIDSAELGGIEDTSL